jgi:hypothetical protein
MSGRSLSHWLVKRLSVYWLLAFIPITLILELTGNRRSRNRHGPGATQGLRANSSLRASCASLGALYDGLRRLAQHADVF